MNFKKKSTVIFTCISVGIIALLATISFLFLFSGKENRPNIVLIMVDDLPIELLSCYGGNLIQTPNLDQLANEGLRFDNCFSTKTILNANSSDHTNSLELSNLLRQNNYQTALIGKWTLATKKMNFDFTNLLVNPDDFYNPDFNENGKIRRENGYVADIITNKAIRFIKTRDTKKPYALFFNFNATDKNCIPATRHLGLFENTIFPVLQPLYQSSIQKDFNSQAAIPENLNRMTPSQKSSFMVVNSKRNETIKLLKSSPNSLNTWKYQQYLRDYLTTMLSLDENIGRLIKYLEDTGELNNTIIICSSNTTLNINRKQLKTPLIIRYPVKIKTNSVSNIYCTNADLFPTLLDISGTKIPYNIEGRSLKPVFEVSGKTPETLTKYESLTNLIRKKNNLTN